MHRWWQHFISGVIKEKETSLSLKFPNGQCLSPSISFSHWWYNCSCRDKAGQWYRLFFSVKVYNTLFPFFLESLRSVNLIVFIFFHRLWPSVYEFAVSRRRWSTTPKIFQYLDYKKIVIVVSFLLKEFMSINFLASYLFFQHRDYACVIRRLALLNALLLCLVYTPSTVKLKSKKGLKDFHVYGKRRAMKICFL